ncbi:hypothetical protein [Amycolatopsis sp. NPDC049159]|uniref:hypothetical protein n=1 Tax=Amycolatopsis sp. NPDC049159 TaxID=3157210 RepID=UPI0033D63DA9
MTEGVSNEVGTAYGPVVQARDIHGDVHVHPFPPASPLVERPISGWSARELGVHEAITLDPAASAEPPCYVVRPHDGEIRGLLRDAAGSSSMVVLVGGSAAGKTRAAYEAVRAVAQLGEWPVVRPSGPRQLVELLARGLPPRRVVWLPDLQRRFFDLPHGPAVAEGLADVLGGPGPVLVVGDVWTAHWAALSTVDSPAVRALLDLPQVRMVRIAESFAGAQAELTRCAGLDPRLALAVRTAGAAVTQVLSGGPQLLRHYVDGLHGPRTHAVVTVAMDVRRLGHESAISADVLRAAAADYLDERDRVVTGDWFADALAGATRQHHGIAALTPTRSAPGLGPPDGYVLHDFLDHHARDAREGERPPAGLWNALAEHVTAADDRSRLATAALQRGLYRLAARYAVPAAEAGDVPAMRLLAFLLELRGATAEAHAWTQRTGDLDRTPLPLDLLLDSGGEPEVEPDPHDAVWQLFRLREDEGRDDEALALLRRLAETQPLAVSMLSVRLRRRGLDHEAETLLRAHAEAGDPAAMWYLGEMLRERKEIDEAAGWFRRSAELSLLAVPLLADALADLGRLEEAEEPLLIQTSKGHRLAAKHLAALSERLGRPAEAEARLRVKLEEGGGQGMVRPAEPHWMKLLTDLLDRAGRTDEAEQLRRYGIEPGGTTAAPWELPVRP